MFECLWQKKEEMQIHSEQKAAKEAKKCQYVFLTEGNEGNEEIQNRNFALPLFASFSSVETLSCVFFDAFAAFASFCSKNYLISLSPRLTRCAHKNAGRGRFG